MLDYKSLQQWRQMAISQLPADWCGRFEAVLDELEDLRADKIELMAVLEHAKRPCTCPKEDYYVDYCQCGAKDLNSKVDIVNAKVEQGKRGILA